MSNFVKDLLRNDYEHIDFSFLCVIVILMIEGDFSKEKKTFQEEGRFLNPMRKILTES